MISAPSQSEVQHQTTMTRSPETPTRKQPNLSPKTITSCAKFKSVHHQAAVIKHLAIVSLVVGLLLAAIDGIMLYYRLQSVDLPNERPTKQPKSLGVMIALACLSAIYILMFLLIALIVWKRWAHFVSEP